MPDLFSDEAFRLAARLARWPRRVAAVLPVPESVMADYVPLWPEDA